MDLLLRHRSKIRLVFPGGESTLWVQLNDTGEAMGPQAHQVIEEKTKLQKDKWNLARCRSVPESYKAASRQALRTSS